MAFFSTVPAKYKLDLIERAYHEQLIAVIVALQKEIELLKARVTALEP